ncbi:MAG: hypothetical protein OER92_09255, partial [Alphaproteobacteria bacterium]|nr:hypothetical protein [Alphaproteobacteria bacterium]
MSSLAPIGNDVPGLYESMPETKVISFAADGTSFLDNLLDIVNPLQHIPVVATIYRSITGDEIGTPARLIGGALFGGPVGFASVAVNLMVEEASGGDLTNLALTLFDDSDATAQLASAATAPTVAPPLPADTALKLPPAIATNADAAEQGASIVWNGPRVLPSLARSTTNVQRSSAADIPLDNSAPNAPDGAIDALAGVSAVAKPKSDSSGNPDQAARPAWLDAAIEDAKSVQGTAQLGQAAPKVGGQPWISEAMLEALEKYQEMTVNRN